MSHTSLSWAGCIIWTVMFLYSWSLTTLNIVGGLFHYHIMVALRLNTGSQIKCSAISSLLDFLLWCHLSHRPGAIWQNIHHPVSFPVQWRLSPKWEKPLLWNNYRHVLLCTLNHIPAFTQQVQLQYVSLKRCSERDESPTVLQMTAARRVFLSYSIISVADILTISATADISPQACRRHSCAHGSDGESQTS